MTPIANAVRTHFVLASLSLACASLPCLTVQYLYQLADPHAGHSLEQLIESLLAVVVFGAVMRRARRAFVQACYAGTIGFPDTLPFYPVIQAECENAWLVHLYIDAHPRHAANLARQRWQGFAASTSEP